MATKKAIYDGTAGGINPITGDRLTTGHATEEYKKGYDKIQWGTMAEKYKNKEAEEYGDEK